VTERLPVEKTYKLYVGGEFPRSESGRTYPVHGADGTFLANAAKGSRKDLREAVRAARGAAAGWADRTAYNRGQILYRIAEMLEGRRAQFVAELDAAGTPDPGAEVDAAVDRWVWYAGWTDKLAQVTGTVNPVAGPYWDFTLPEPTGVVGVVVPARPALLGLVSHVAPVIAAGNVAVVVASPDQPLPAVSFAEVLATSDLPGGVVNLLTGDPVELAPWLIGHLDVNAVDLTGLAPDPDTDAEAAANVKRVVRHDVDDYHADSAQRLSMMTAVMEYKTVWHPVGV
jgi:acyl-CoA reductase-like NAD-dependent aldehyde dehydrogenase